MRFIYQRITGGHHLVLQICPESNRKHKLHQNSTLHFPRENPGKHGQHLHEFFPRRPKHLWVMFHVLHILGFAQKAAPLRTQNVPKLSLMDSPNGGHFNWDNVSPVSLYKFLPCLTCLSLFGLRGEKTNMIHPQKNTNHPSAQGSLAYLRLMWLGTRLTTSFSSSPDMYSWLSFMVS